MWCVYSIACRSNPKRFLSILFVFGSVTYVLKVFLKMSNSLCWKNLRLTILRLLSWVDPSREIFRKFQFLKNCRQRVSQLPHKCFAAPLWVPCSSALTRKILPCAFSHFVSRLVNGSRVTNSWNLRKDSFKGLKISIFKNLVFLLLATSSP